MKRQITNKKYILNNRLSPDIVNKILSLKGEATDNTNGGAPVEYLTEEQRKMKKI